MKTSTSQVKLAGLVMIAANVWLHPIQAATSASELLPTPLPRVKDADPAPALSDATLQIVQLTRSGIDEGVVLVFIENSAAFNLTADHIIYLNNVGVPIRALNAMLAHDLKIYSRTHDSVITNRLASVREAASQTHRTSRPTDALNQTSTSQSPIPEATTPAINQSEVMLQPAATVSAQAHAGVRAAAEFPTQVAPDTRAIAPRLTPKKAGSLYPVRAPYPVELTIPIVLLEYPTF